MYPCLRYCCRRLWLPSLLLALTLGALPARAASDPLDSARWEEMRKEFLPRAQVVFDPRVRVEAPTSSEMPMQVPVAVDATALTEVEEVLVFADFNPLPRVLRFVPGSARPYLGFRLKLQQSTPVRAAVRTRDGIWHVGGSWVNTTGGGCTVPSVAASSSEWQRRLNEVGGLLRQEAGSAEGRLRLRVVHPMDTGLISGIPAFFLQDISLRDSHGGLLMQIEPGEPVSENPVFTLRLPAPLPLAVEVRGSDNNGNRLQARITP